MKTLTSTPHQPTRAAQIRHLRARIARLERAERRRLRTRPSTPPASCADVSPATADDAAWYRKYLRDEFPPNIGQW